MYFSPNVEKRRRTEGWAKTPNSELRTPNSDRKGPGKLQCLVAWGCKKMWFLTSAISAFDFYFLLALSALIHRSVVPLGHFYDLSNNDIYISTNDKP